MLGNLIIKLILLIYSSMRLSIVQMYSIIILRFHNFFNNPFEVPFSIYLLVLSNFFKFLIRNSIAESLSFSALLNRSISVRILPILSRLILLIITFSHISKSTSSPYVTARMNKSVIIVISTFILPV